MGGQPHDLSRPSAGAVGVRSCGCRRRSCPGGSDAALAPATICASGPGRDQEPRQSAADQTQLTDRDPYCFAATKNEVAVHPLNVLVTFSREFLSCAREGTDVELSARHPPGRPAPT